MLKRFCVALTSFCLTFGEIRELQADPITNPRVQQTDMKYLGAFALPQGQFGSSNFAYGGNGVTPYRDPTTGKMTLFMEGHAWYPGEVAQIEVPATLLKNASYNSLVDAQVLQPFTDVMDGKSGTLNQNQDGNNIVYGMLAYHNRLIVGAANFYDAGGHQNRSHGASSLTLSSSNDFSGFVALNAAAPPRALGGYMATIPPEWQSLLGGPVLTGNDSLNIISNSSSGPAATVFNPDDIGVKNPVPATTLLFYPLAHPYTDNFNSLTGSGAKGVAFPNGSRSVLFIGRSSNTDYCYGEGVNDPALHKQPSPGGTYCYDPCNSSKGGHGYPYYHHVWAYDANDLLKVKNGQKQPWELTPYTSWRLTDMENDGCAGMRSAGFDPVTSRLYIAQAFGDQPKIDVYEITPVGTPAKIPSAPRNLRVSP